MTTQQIELAAQVAKPCDGFDNRTTLSALSLALTGAAWHAYCGNVHMARNAAVEAFNNAMHQYHQGQMRAGLWRS